MAAKPKGERAAGSHAGANGKGKGGRTRARALTSLAFVVVIAAGYFLHIGIGNFCGIGFLDVALVCPLGSLEAMLAARSFIPQALISLVVFLVIVAIVGRAFCGWLCPVPWVQRVFPGLNRSRAERARRRAAKERRRAERARALAQEEAEEESDEGVSARETGVASQSAPDAPSPAAHTPSPISDDERDQILRSMGACTDGHGHLTGETGAGPHAGKSAHALRARFDTPEVVLLVVLVTTAVFGFPVFCLVCPVGLTFAFVLLVMRLFAFGELTWALLVFPAIVLAEVALLPRWCRTLCPLGALHSLAAHANVTWRPTVDPELCLETSRNVSCGRCLQVCPQDIDLHAAGSGAPLNACEKCGACADACPTKAIGFPAVRTRHTRVP